MGYGGVVSSVLGAVSSAQGALSSAKTTQANLRLQAIESDAQATYAKTQAAMARANAGLVRATGNVNAQMATLTGETNARTAEAAAANALEIGQDQVAALTLKAGQLKGAQRVALAANGIAINEGSAREVQASTDVLKQADMDTLTANAARSAWGYRTQAANDRTAADWQALNYQNNAANEARNLDQGAQMQGITAASYERSAGSQLATARAISPNLAAATSLLGSAGSVASSWYRYRKEIQDSKKEKKP